MHIQVTAGREFTSSQTGTSSTAARSLIRPPRLAGRRTSGESGAVGIEGRVLQNAHALQDHGIGEPGGDAGKQERRDRLAGRQGPPVGECRHVEVEVRAVEVKLGDLVILAEVTVVGTSVRAVDWTVVRV